MHSKRPMNICAAAIDSGAVVGNRAAGHSKIRLIYIHATAAGYRHIFADCTALHLKNAVFSDNHTATVFCGGVIRNRTTFQ